MSAQSKERSKALSRLEHLKILREESPLAADVAVYIRESWLMERGDVRVGDLYLLYGEALMRVGLNPMCEINRALSLLDRLGIIDLSDHQSILPR